IVRRTSGREIVPNAGVRWKVSPRVALAAAYNGGGTFRRTNEACYASGDGCGSELALLNESEVRMPDAWRASVSVQPVKNLHLAAEAVRRNYSNLNQADTGLGEGSAGLPYEDLTELHAGAEYRLNRVALRAGWWRDPARVNDSAYHDYYLGRDHDHITFGAGIDLGGSRLDIAFDDPEDEMLRRASIGVTFAVAGR
ncbi:MAG TPA: hypothetical protein VHK90_13485, partial [Thermoanaerobaculia bacterium]|nr:hypothetical protein [Thermoanaerobaculia bacterium]